MNKKEQGKTQLMLMKNDVLLSIYLSSRTLSTFLYDKNSFIIVLKCPSYSTVMDGFTGKNTSKIQGFMYVLGSGLRDRVLKDWKPQSKIRKESLPGERQFVIFKVWSISWGTTYKLGLMSFLLTTFTFMHEIEFNCLVSVCQW